MIGNGFITTFATNYVGPSIFAARSAQPNLDPVRSLLVDIVVKILVFILLTAFTYCVYGRFYGSFAGDIRLALHAVGPTISDAIFFRNLTSVYLYSVAIASPPLYLSALVEIMADHPQISRAIGFVFFWLPFHQKPVRSLAVVLGAFFAIFASAAAIFTNVVSQWT